MADWLPITGFDGLYEVSNLGEVRSIGRKVAHWRGGKRRTAGQLLKPKNVKGYCHVALQDAPRVIQASIHRLVAEAFIPNPENKPHINHKDGNKKNNAVSNLEWVTSSENNAHAFAIGLRSSKGERCTNAKLRDSDVLKIKERLATGESCAAIAADYPVKKGAIAKIKRGDGWSHI